MKKKKLKFPFNADCEKYYDETQKRNIWVLGYFGGGAVNICAAMELAKQYAKSTGVPLETVCIDEILHSRRHKGFKFIYSQTKQQKPESDCRNTMENVFKWLCD